MILHVANLDKFIPPFVRLVKEEFHNEKHQFWFKGSVKQYPVEQSHSVYVCGNGLWKRLKGYAKLIRQLHTARKIMLHGLFNTWTVVILALCPWVLPKCHWFIWGGDLYRHKEVSKGLGSKIEEMLRRFVIRRIGYLVSYVEGDVELAREWYGAKGTYRECIMYLSNVVDPQITGDANHKPDKNGLNILLGNSANKSNNHIEAFEKLLPYKNQDVRIFVPLSYGDRNNAQKVIKQGKEWFGDKFIPMTDFMPFDQYLEFLKNIDIAIFNHQRQQAMGNIITLLGMGKTVFLRSDVSHWRFLQGLGVNVNDVNELRLQPIVKEKAQQNSEIVGSYFSRTILTQQLADIFER